MSAPSKAVANKLGNPAPVEGNEAGKSDGGAASTIRAEQDRNVEQASRLPENERAARSTLGSEQDALREMKDLLKLRHYSPRTLQTYTE
jgi:hypothetical protein